MLPLIVFVPVIVGAALMIALILGTATAGAYETFEERRDRRELSAVPRHLKVADRRESSARAA